MFSEAGKKLRTPFTIALLYRNVVRQKRFIRKHLLPELQPFRQKNDKSLSEKDFKKITAYYGFGVPAVLGEAICELRGKPMRLEERWASTSQGALTGLFDDFFDEWGIPEEKLLKLVHDPESYLTENTNQELFLHFYLKTLKLCRYPENVKASLTDVLHAQTASLKQAGKTQLETSEILDITYHKGGLSLLFYRHVFDHEMDEAEGECLHALGAALQLVNDCFDVYKDREAGIQTMVTRCTHIAEVRQQYKMWMSDFFRKAEQLNVPDANKHRLMRMISLGAARADVCLEQLEGLETKSENCFDLNRYSRKELIVDMDTVGNIWKSVRYHMINSIL